MTTAKVSQQKMKTKTCDRCKKVLPYDAFHISNFEVTGRQNYCKVCKKEYQQEEREKERLELEKKNELSDLMETISEYIFIFSNSTNKKTLTVIKEVKKLCSQLN